MRTTKNAVCFGIAVLATSSAYAEGPIDGKVYGRIDLNFGLFDSEANDGEKYDVISNSSRIGFKGETDLGDGLAAIYKAEFGFDAGQKGGAGLEYRSLYTGIKGGFGSVKLGHIDSPLKKSQGKFDQFNDYEGDLKKVMGGDERLSSLQYSTPEFAGAQFNLALQPGEEEGVEDKDGPADRMSASITYKLQGLHVGLGYDSNKPDEKDYTRFTATYQWNTLHVGALYQMVKTEKEGDKFGNGEEDANGTGLSVAYGIGKAVIKAQHLASEEKAEEATSTSLGVDYLLGKKTKTYAFHTMFDQKGEKSKSSRTAIGIQHKF